MFETCIAKVCKDKKKANNILYNLFKKFLRVVIVKSCFLWYSEHILRVLAISDDETNIFNMLPYYLTGCTITLGGVVRIDR